MQNLDPKIQADVAEATDLIEQWRKKIHSIFMDADYHNQQNVIDFLWQYVVDHQQITYDRLLRRLERARTPSNPPASTLTATKDQSNNGRMAAMFPGMHGVPAVGIVAGTPQMGQMVLNPPMGIVQGIGKSEMPGLSPGGREKAPVESVLSPVDMGSASTNGAKPPPWVKVEKVGLPMNWRDAVGASSSMPPPNKVPSSNGRNGTMTMNGELSSTSSLMDDLTRLNTEDSASNDGSDDGVVQPRKVFLTNLARDSESKTIADCFKQFGTVVDVKIFRFPNGESRGFGAVEFKDEISARKAIGSGKHLIDGREVDVKVFRLREGVPSLRGVKRFQIFLGGVPSFLSKEEVTQIISRQVKVRELKLNSERGYGYLDLEKESDVEKLLKAGYIKVGEKMVECKENYRQ